MILLILTNCDRVFKTPLLFIIIKLQAVVTQKHKCVIVLSSVTHHAMSLEISGKWRTECHIIMFILPYPATCRI